MAKKIFFGNYKGGVGKTTSTFYLAKNFAELLNEDSKRINKKVLIIDLDPQCSMSEVCIRSNNRNLELADNSFDNNETLNYILHMIYKNKKYNLNIGFDLHSIIKSCKGAHKNVDFIPTSLYYNNNMGLDGLIDVFQESITDNVFLLYEVIQLVEDKYELILFDCPPSNNILTKSAFLLSDYYIIPYISDNISIKGVQHYISTVNKIYDMYCNAEVNCNADFYRHIFKERPRLLGLFECMRIRNENARGDIRTIDAKIYRTVIKNLIDIQEKLNQGNVSHEQGKYQELAEEIYQDIYTP